ncbi:hypothetical protein SAMN02910358_01200 [Lachnospiraceae bacterium XBB1006]|nr:hypothetical protein SAMN02910358_01200 [Lachnospiraceae bacterium XBB1006]
MKEWLILCDSRQVEIEKRRFAELQNVEIVSFNQNNRKYITEQLDAGKLVISVGGMPQFLEKTNHSGCVYWLMDENPMNVRDKIDKLDSGIHILVMDKIFQKNLKQILRRDAEYIGPDGNCYIEPGESVKRKIPVLIAAHYLNPEDGIRVLKKRTSEDLYPLLERVIKKSKKDIVKTDEVCWREVLEEEDLEYDQDLLDELIEVFHGNIVSILNRFNLEKSVKTLLDKDIPVAVIGENWKIFKEKMPEEKHELIDIRNEWIDMNTMIPEMKKSKAFLSVDWNYHDGISVQNQLAMNLGCTLVAEKNPITEKLEKAGAPLVTYPASRPSECAKRIEKILATDEKKRVKPNSRPLSSGLVDWLARQ